MKNRKKSIPKKPLKEKFFAEKTVEERKETIEKFLGIIKLQEDPVVMQRRWRDEWE